MYLENKVMIYSYISYFCQQISNIEAKWKINLSRKRCAYKPDGIRKR